MWTLTVRSQDRSWHVPYYMLHMECCLLLQYNDSQMIWFVNNREIEWPDSADKRQWPGSLGGLLWCSLPTWGPRQAQAWLKFFSMRCVWVMVPGWRNSPGVSAMSSEVTRLPRSLLARRVVLTAPGGPVTHVMGMLRMMLGDMQIFSIFKMLYFFSFVRKENKFK